MLTESGLLYLKMGETQPAFERLSSALALDPVCPKALLGMGCITQVKILQYKICSFKHSFYSHIKNMTWL